MTDPNAELERLIQAWCDRRHYAALRIVLPAWPAGPLTDSWANLLEALRTLRAARTLPEDESLVVSRLIDEIDIAVYRR